MYRRTYKISMENPENPKCNMCKKGWKPDDTDIKKSGEVYKTCKNCRERNKDYYENNKGKIAEIGKKYRENNKEKLVEKMKDYYENNKEKIAKERKEYRENNKEKLVEKLKDYYENNKGKIVEKMKDYYENNKYKIAEKHKEYRENNQENIAKRNKDYYENNKKKIAERGKKYREENKCEHNKEKGKCKICNLSLYLVNKQRWNIHRCLKISSQNKTKSSIEYLGCDVEYFIEYFKKKMDIYNETAEIKMNWDNIHIDHIKPVSSFNLDNKEELNKCCNYTNFQPLFAKDNLTKLNKWTDEDEEYWNENIINKEHFGIYLSV